MKLLRCRFCRGEVDIVGNERSVVKKVKCRQCNHANNEEEQKTPEVLVIRKRPIQ